MEAGFLLKTYRWIIEVLMCLMLLEHILVDLKVFL